MQTGDLELETELIYETAGLDPSEPGEPAALARHGVGALLKPLDEAVLPLGGCNALIRGRWHIFYARTLRGARLKHVLLHEAAEVHLRQCGLVGDELEACADMLAGALAAPRQCFFNALDYTGRCYRSLAKCFDHTPTWGALRFAETTHEPMALVTDRSVRVRGCSGFKWPDEIAVRAMATGPLPLGVSREEISSGRTVLRASNYDSLASQTCLRLTGN